MRNRFVTLGAQRIHLHESGLEESEDPVLLLHSGGFTSRQWRRLGEMLAPSHRVIAPDLLGYGESTAIADKAPFHYRDDVALLGVLLEEVNRPVHVVGHSYGGLLALQLALAHPKKVKSLALYEPVAFGALGSNGAHGAAAEGEVRRELDEIRLEPNASGSIDDAWLSAFVDWWNGQGAWDALNAETKDAFRHVGWKVFQEVVSLAEDRTSLETYATVTAPTLFLGGAMSPNVERQVIARLAAALPHATLDVLEGVGHMGPITHASKVNRLIADHIASNV